MEGTALSFRLMMFFFILLSAGVQLNDAVFHIVPTRLQLFEHESVSFYCEGLMDSTQLRGIRNTEGFLSPCEVNRTSIVSCSIPRAYQADSGKYWCEDKAGEISSSVNISVSAGSVILESPVLAVTEGHNVTLSCRNKASLSNVTAAFYKDGELIRSSSTGEMILHSVSTADEGLYKCDVSAVGESPQSWLAVRALHRETSRSSEDSYHVYLVFRTVLFTVMVSLLLLLLGLLHYRKLRLTLNDWWSHVKVTE